MKKTHMISYEEKNTWLHSLCGVTKLIFFLLWSVTSMLTYDTRILAVMLVVSMILFRISKTEWRQISAVFKFILFFLCVNLIAVFVFSPYEGSKIYGTWTFVCHFLPGYDITAEQLFYELNILLKYLTIVPAVFLFLVTTNPSEFAASMNRIGISYKVSYAIAIALRYIPDVQDDYTKIKNAQEARGIEMSRKAKLGNRIRSCAAILLPLILSSMERINVVSSAMELRGFGKHKKRTWYMGRPMTKADCISLIFTVVFCAGALIITFAHGSRFYNPFVH
jgi:energy-coupling factor transport system permease protein